MDIFDRLNDKVLQKLRKCKGKKTCEGLSCRGFYFETNKKAIKKWQEEGRTMVSYELQTK